eukprot:gnl/MRDRNA2_/MRDRNA2_105793_c0_seq1.p2 gnl/MRDRNA2_/MRDRNA2_105793_c0~~gnl/MRDRNA2_/MRDRNA2_105793_c0_seq1.p2  ORF type:complete len:144 (+),score=32.13 gnl/MRDRNA2_/MRDRNA2_105793_c0_seq1:29-460(+)
MSSEKMEPKLLWKIALPEECKTWEVDGVLSGSDLDHKDGFLHFSSITMVKKVASMFFSGKNVKLLQIDPAALPQGIQWVSGDSNTDESLKERVAAGEGTFVRALVDGCMHVHLQEPLSMKAVTGSFEVGLGPDGTHIFPEECA